MPNIYAVGDDGKVSEVADELRRFASFMTLIECLTIYEALASGGGRALSFPMRFGRVWRIRTQTRRRLGWKCVQLTIRFGPAKHRYISEHGADHLYLLVEMLFEELFPANQQASSKAL